MDSIFVNPENSKILDRLFLNLSDKIDLKQSDKYVSFFSKLSIYYIWKNMKKSYKNNKFKISRSKWNEKFELPGRSFLYQIFKIIVIIS